MYYLRLRLLAAYLDAEPASVAILNDYLMEQGEEPGRLHGNASRRLRVVLGLIPRDLSHRLGCDFAEHVADLFEAALPKDGRVREVIEIKRRWTRGEAAHEQLKAARWRVREAMDELRRGSLPAAGATSRLAYLQWHDEWRRRAAAEQAARAAFYASTLSDHTARDCCGAAVRAAAEAPTAWGRSDVRESLWQIEHCRQVLLQSEEPGVRSQE